MSRKRTFLLLAAFAALAAVLSACGGGGGGSSADPQQVIENATFEGVESGTVDLTMNVKATGEHGGNLKVDLSGPFQSTGKESLPELALALKANGEADGEPVDFEGGLTTLADRAYVGYEGKQYEVEPTLFSYIRSGFEEAQQEGAKESKGGEATACQKAATSLKLEEFVDNLENEGGEEVDGVKTTKLSGDLDPKGGVDAIIKLMETPACSSELEAAGPFPLAELKKQESQLTDAIKEAHVQVYVGEDDHIVRKVVADLTAEPKGSGESVEIELDFTLGEVNEPQAIKAPANAESLEKLFGKLGVNPLELLGAMQGGGGQSLGSLLEGLTGSIQTEGSFHGDEGSSGGKSSGPELELPSTGASKEFKECLSEAKSAADVQECATLME
ncbi:MAG TPA: hypothetical protein VHB53_08000 [Solirubrobacterales bacterium]|nr:hypothetical protein [Solirubrobacterales bacterium]